MTINELMIKYNFITKILLRDGDRELSKDLKVKLMNMRIKLGKVKKELEEDLQEAVRQLTPEGYHALVMKEDKTDEDKAQVEAWNKQINEEYNAYVDKRGKEEVDMETPCAAPSPTSAAVPSGWDTGSLQNLKSRVLPLPRAG